jgi:hypothetical protein
MLYSEIIAVCSQIHTKHINTLCGQNVEISDAFAKLRKVSVSFVMSVRLSAWNNSAPTGRSSMKFYTCAFFENLLRMFKFHENLTRIRVINLKTFSHLWLFSEWFWGLQEVQGPRFFKESAHEGGKVVSPTHRPPFLPREDPWNLLPSQDYSTQVS